MSVNTGNDSLQGDDMATMVRFAQNLSTSSCHLMEGSWNDRSWIKQKKSLPEALASRGLPLSLPRNFMPVQQFLNENVYCLKICLCNNFSMKLSTIWKSNQGLSPSLPGSAGWELLSHSHIQWPPVMLERIANNENHKNSRRDSYYNIGIIVKAEARDKCCSHLGLLTYLGGQVFLRHLFGLPTLGNQLPHIHVNLCGYCIVDKLNIAGVRLLYQEFGGF